MMTTIGKGLAFVNLLLGMAMLTWAVTLYTQRPSWLDAKYDGPVPAGQHPESIAQLKEDIDGLGRAAAAASANWGAQRKLLEDREKTRADRQKAFADRLGWARNGNPRDKDGGAFYEPTYDPDTGLLDLATTGTVVKGPDSLPLQGVNRLGGRFAADVAEVAKLSRQIDKSRERFAALGTDILDVDRRLLKMVTIRDSVQAELFHLATVEVNVYETRETVTRRKRQLTGRLAELK